MSGKPDMTKGTTVEVSSMEGAPAMLIFAEIAAYQAPGSAPNENTQLCQALLESLMALARAGGFAQGDVLCTILARGRISERGGRMATAAMEAAEAALAALALESIVADATGGAHD